MFGNDLFTGMPEWLKKKKEEDMQALLNSRKSESPSWDAAQPIDAREAERLKNSPLHIIEQTDLSKKGMMPVVDASGKVTGSGMHPGEESGYQPLGTQNTIPSAITVPSQSGDPLLAPSHPDQTTYRTPQGTPAVASGPKLTPEARQTYTSYSKSLDKSYMAALLQSAIPENQPAPSGISGGGAHGGGNNLANMQPFFTGQKRKEKNPALWRYSNV